MMVLLMAAPAMVDGLKADCPNIIFILTDDQRWDIFPGAADYIPEEVMTEVQAHFVGEGVVFRNAVLSNPLCCPTRTSLLTGGMYCHHTGVLNNAYPNGGAVRFFDRVSLATRMQEQGYRTALIGKYLNQLGSVTGEDVDGQPIGRSHYVAPGWDVFVATSGTGDYLDYSLLVGSTDARGPRTGLVLPDELAERDSFLQGLLKRGFPAQLGDYVRNLEFPPPYISTLTEEAAAALIDDYGTGAEPFFLMISTNAPHTPATPDERDEELYPDFEYHARSWGEADLKDKPDYVRALAEQFDGIYDGSIPFPSRRHARLPDEFFRDQIRCMKGIDRLVGTVVDAVDSNPRLRDRTILVFMSDNGFLWGEHSVFKKRLPYEEAIRCSLAVRMPDRTPRTVDELVVAELDLGSMFLEWAGLPRREIRTWGSDGQSLSALISGEQDRPWKRVLLQNYTEPESGEPIPFWAGVRSSRWKLVQHDSGEAELYDLRKDPFEEESLHDDASDRSQRQKRRLGRSLDRMRGLVVTADGISDGFLPPAVVGAPYEFQFTARGGTEPYRWSLFPSDGLDAEPGCTTALPNGLTLSSNGRLSGSPTEPGCFTLFAAVEDASSHPPHQTPQRHVRRVSVNVSKP